MRGAAAYSPSLMTDRPQPAPETAFSVTRQPVPDQLRAKGEDTLGHETTLARAPPFWPQRAVQLDLLASPMLYARPFRQSAGSPLTTADQRLLAEFTTHWLRAGAPANRTVPYTLASAARILGQADPGGKNRRIVRASLVRLASCLLESALRIQRADGVEAPPSLAVEDAPVYAWHLLSNFLLPSSTGNRPGSVTISEEIAYLLRTGSVTYLHAPTWDAIAAQDELAARLWCFLEAEDLTRGWHYQLFPAPPGQVALERNLPAIAELLRIDQWSKRRNVAERVRELCTVISTADPRYQLELVKGKGVGMWRLDVGPRRPHRAVPRRGFAGLSRLVMGAWQGAYGDRKPSKKQIAVLRELTDRLGATWVASHLPHDHPDPFASLMAMAGAQSDADLAAAAQREARWAREKARIQDETHLAALLVGGVPCLNPPPSE